MQTTLAQPPRERLHGLDAVRGIALLLGLVVHASMAWIPGAQYFWVVSDASPGEFAGLLFYVPHMFRMLLFFLVAGLFARMACERLGTLAFIRDRARRIAIPLASLWFPMLMAIVAVIAWNAWLVNDGTMPPARKQLVASGAVQVDGVTELRKTAKIRAGQQVRVDDVAIRVVAG